MVFLVLLSEVWGSLNPVVQHEFLYPSHSALGFEDSTTPLTCLQMLTSPRTSYPLEVLEIRVHWSYVSTGMLLSGRLSCLSVPECTGLRLMLSTMAQPQGPDLEPCHSVAFLSSHPSS